MNVWLELTSHWHWSSLAWLGAVVLLIAMVRLFHPTPGLRLVPLAIALITFLLAFVSPIGVLAEGYLFSAHIVQHLALLLVVPMCLLLSVSPRHFAEKDSMPIRGPASWLGNPVIGWSCGLGAMWFWHVPSLCSAATTHWTVGLVRDTSLLLAGLAFWWPIFAPRNRCRLAPPAAIVYLFSACLGCTLLGIYLTFTTVSVCPAFANPVDRLGLLTNLYDVGMTSSVDQQLGGLLMWIPPCSLYVGVILSVLGRWYSTPDAVPDRRYAEFH